MITHFFRAFFASPLLLGVVLVLQGPDTRREAPGKGGGDTEKPFQGELYRWHRGGQRICGLSFSPDGKLLASGDMAGRIRLWSTSTGKEIRQFNAKGSISNLVFSPNGKTLTSGGWFGDGTIQLWEVATGKELRVIGQQPVVTGLAFSPDGKALAASSNVNVHLWDVLQSKELRCWRISGAVDSVAFSPDGKAVAAGIYDGTTRLWSVTTGKQIRRFEFAEKLLNCPIESVAFSRDGKTLATGGQSDTVCLWETATGKKRRHWGKKESMFFRVAFTPDGRRLAGSHGDSIGLWDAVTGKELHRWSSTDRPFALSANGQTHAFIDGALLLRQDLLEFDLDPKGKGETVLSPRELDLLWDELGDDDAGRAYQAIWKLVGSADQALPLLSNKLHPKSGLDENRVVQLISQLGRAQPGVSDKAFEELEKLGGWAELALRNALGGKPSEVVRPKLEALIERLEGAVPESETLRDLRTIEVLEHIGSAKSRRILKAMAKGTHYDRITQEAQRSLERLESINNR